MNVEFGTATEAAGQTLPNLVTVPIGLGGRVNLFTQGGAHLIADVAGYYQSVSESASGRFTPTAPTRLLDTRPASGPLAYSGPKPAADQTVTFPVAGRGGVPATGVSSVVLTVTVADATARGFVTAYPAGAPLPWASNLNAELAGQSIANQVVVPLRPDGAVSIYTQSGAHLVADLAGWFTDASAPAGTAGLFVPMMPTRELDTRNGGGAKPGAGATVAVPVVLPTVPNSAASAVIVNLTATEATARGYVVAHPEPTVVPWASNLNLQRAGQTLSAHATVALGIDGNFAITTQSGAHVIADVAGWYRAA